MAASTTVFIPKDLQGALIESCKESVSLIGFTPSASCVRVLAAVQTQHLGSLVWAPDGLDTVGYMKAEQHHLDSDTSDELNLFVHKSSLCGFRGGHAVQIHELKAQPSLKVAVAVAALRLPLTSLHDHARIDLEQEAQRLQHTVYHGTGGQQDHASNTEVLMPDVPEAQATESTAEPHESSDNAEIYFSLEVLVHVTGSEDCASSDEVKQAIASSMSDRLRTAATQLESWSESSKCTPTGACITHFQLPCQAAPLSVLYPVPINTPASHERTEELQKWRRTLHIATLCSTDTPLFRLGQRLRFGTPASPCCQTQASKLKDVHKHVQPSPLATKSESFQVRTTTVWGSYEYYHYKHDGINDVGWGCAYRSLQTLWSWFQRQRFTDRPVPTHRQIQECLVSIGDKQASFLGSQEWLGAVEVGMVLQQELGLDYRVLSVSSGTLMPTKVREIAAHFQTEGTPISIGGGVLAYTLLGVEWIPETGEAAFLILDPHYTGADEMGPVLGGKWVAWKQLGQKAAAGGPLFRKDAFYNLLCPFRPREI